jgi:hypothetical protein
VCTRLGPHDFRDQVGVEDEHGSKFGEARSNSRLATGTSIPSKEANRRRMATPRSCGRSLVLSQGGPQHVACLVRHGQAVPRRARA